MLGEDYIYWLLDRYGSHEYESLFKQLASKDYRWHFVLDESRAKAGLTLRQQFAYEAGVYLSDVADGPCSCLEMLCALSSAMYDMCGQCDPRHFLAEMLGNLGLSFFAGSREVNDILDRWLDGNFDPNGRGSIYDFKNVTIGRDVRSMDVWSQMNLYLNVFYPFDENYLRS